MPDASFLICDVCPPRAALLAVVDEDALGVTDGRRRARVVGSWSTGWAGTSAGIGRRAPLLASVLAGDAVARRTRLHLPFHHTDEPGVVGHRRRTGRARVLGFTVKLPDTDRVLNHIFWRDDPAPTQWQPVPTWFERLRQAASTPGAVLPRHSRQRPYRGGIPGAHFVAAENGDDYARLVVDQLRAAPD